MYSMKCDTYSCDLCDFEMEWDGHDKDHGDMWECEQCGDHFCSKCFIDRHGRKDFMDMLQNGNEVLCPECYRKEKS